MLLLDAKDYLVETGRYEDTYGQYMELFKTVAYTPLSEEVLVTACPVSWGPLLRALGAKVHLIGTEQFPQEHHMKGACYSFCSEPIDPLARTQLEVLCAIRPETADALWKCDVQWKTERTRQGYFATVQREFIVTNNGSFHRHEIQVYLEALRDYMPTHENIVLLPCAADKPYPSPLHQKVLDMLPKDGTWDIMNATGVLGLVPRDLWPVMPYYDSGIPNEWRLMNIAAWYFDKHRFHYKKIIAHTDYYSLALQRAMRISSGGFSGPVWTFTNQPSFIYDYIDLMSEEQLSRLAQAIVNQPSKNSHPHVTFADPIGFLGFGEQP